MPSSRKNHMPGTGLSSYMSRLRLVPSKQTVFFRIGKLSKTSETKILYICRTISSVPSWTENSSQPVLCAHQSQALFTGISCMMQKRSCHYQSPQTGMLANHLTDSRCSELHCSRRVNGLRLQVYFWEIYKELTKNRQNLVTVDLISKEIEMPLPMTLHARIFDDGDFSSKIQLWSKVHLNVRNLNLFTWLIQWHGGLLLGVNDFSNLLQELSCFSQPLRIS